MLKPPDTRITWYARAQIGEVLQQIDMVEESVGEPLTCLRVILPRPAHDLLQVGYRWFGVEKLEIHWGMSLRTSSLETTRPSSAARIPASITARVSSSTLTSSAEI